MKDSRLSPKELELIDKAIRTCPELVADVNMQIRTNEDAAQFLITMFTDGMRLCKYRKKIEQINTVNSEINQAKTEAISALDAVIENILDMIQKTFNTLKESTNK